MGGEGKALARSIEGKKDAEKCVLAKGGRRGVTSRGG